MTAPAPRTETPGTETPIGAPRHAVEELSATVALPLPGRSGHWLKFLLTRYLLWKLRTGRTYLP